MERRNMFVGIGIVLLILVITAAIIFSMQKKDNIPQEILLKIKEAEISLEKNGAKNIAGIHPKYEKIELEYYYKYDYCFDVIKSTIRKFNGLINLKNAKKLKNINKNLLKELNIQEIGNNIPIAALSGNADIYDDGGNYIKPEDSFKTLVYGISACSEKIMAYNLCSTLKNKPEVCKEFSIKEENINVEKSIPQDFVCYDSCNIKHLSDNKISMENWQGLPCNRIDGYVEGDSKVKSKECYDKSCKNDINDLGCCKSTECVENGKCYQLFVDKDIDVDGQIELCAKVNDASLWVNPDINPEACSNAGFKWFNCINEEECRYGINNYDKKGKELCCGDDKGEHVTECKGEICNSNDFACCTANSCVFNGKCYQSGCNQIESNSGEKISTFCDGNTNNWIDLDDSHCAECLGKKAWSGTICCGDDAKEGGYPIRFINSKNEINQVVYYGCADKKSDCVYPYIEASFGEGFYIFKEDAQYLQGGYYCNNNQWRSLDNNSKYCKESGFNWDNNKQICCGDNANEFYIKGSDGTSACCSLPNEIVAGDKCHPTTLCGNNVLNDGESCELPNTKNNTYCKQQGSQCLGNKLGIRYARGYCNANCQCQGDEFVYSCVKNSCGAECGSDNDCSQDSKCDLNSCSCESKTYCGDNIVQSYNDFVQKEECEPPNTTNNSYCKVEQCKGKKSISTAIRVNYNYSTCKNDCQCDYVSVEYSCKKGACGAECNQDGSDCGDGSLCNTQTCSCESKPVVCGDGICEHGEETSCPNDCKKSACPYRIDLKLDKNNYYLNDTITLEIITYNANNDLLPETKFDLDILVNDVLVGSSTYSTSSTGSYIIKKKVTNFAPSGIHQYIAKTKVVGCGIVSDTTIAYVYVNNPYTIPPQKINYSRFEFITDVLDVTNERIISKCGDNIVGYGEACEGNNICRYSFGCDYINKIYDFAEYCEKCSCPEDKESEPSGVDYCSNCNSCGDGTVNCDEECENGTISKGLICKNEKLYERVDACFNCKWTDDGISSDAFIDACECKCQKNPEINCINGNYINYTQDYNAGCSDGRCNSCNCIDTYTKDNGNDGIEDKCSQELCGNKIDDNDNGLIDEKGCIWYYCSQCGYGLFNFCTRKECSKFEQGCFFNKFEYKFFNYTLGTCNACPSIKSCEEYKYDNITCTNDPCTIGNCAFDGKQCCTDNDKDNVCDSKDNCLALFNPNQEDSDKDGKGDACEFCINEPLLVEPTEQKELSCSDGIDNDCDGLADCKDTDCIGILNCCNNSKDCEQSNCTIERCMNNRCDYRYRYLCDNRECSKGQYCDIDGQCKEPDSSESVCLFCISDATINDYGISYGNSFTAFSNSAENICCGDEDNEYTIIQEETNKSACCDSSTACVDYLGNCHNTNTPTYEAHNWHCSVNSWYECSSNKSVLCAEAGFAYNSNFQYKTKNETAWYCTYDGTGFAWRKTYPKEICNDYFDNDCDKKIDFDDEDCQKTK